MSFDIDIAGRVGGTDIAVRIESGAGLTVLFGPSGVGKTSILNMIAGLIRPTRGYVRVAGQTLFDSAAGVSVTPRRRGAGYVFQDPRLFPHMRARDNLLYGYRLAPPNDRWLELAEAASFLDISHLLDRWPRSLSGGEARRVAIGRALLGGPRFLLLDEPLSSLDRARREEIMRAIEHIRDELRVPILMVTHDADEAERLATQIVRL
jgi:molybdate transport system ATP-binding protein